MTALRTKIAATAATIAARLLDRYAPRSGGNGDHDAAQPYPQIPAESDELTRTDCRELAAGLARLADLTRQLGDPAAAARHLWGDQ
ncbi:hypothetical protein [Actinomadura sp. WMMA1423]|uniref:hypothetical protein n=1 Tax=Actinomadura sp. WMMA1423 TaxID=2591108 RepID=UPI0011471FE1|nr:hypothetical protein [Actinomadura sp. WMMA1423]